MVLVGIQYQWLYLVYVKVGNPTIRLGDVDSRYRNQYMSYQLTSVLRSDGSVILYTLDTMDDPPGMGLAGTSHHRLCTVYVQALSPRIT